MIFNSEDLSSSGLGTFDEKFLVDGFQREGIHHSDVDAFLGQGISSNAGLLKGDTRSHHCHFVSVTRADNLGQCDGDIVSAYRAATQSCLLAPRPLPTHLALSDLEHLIWFVDDGCLWSAGADEGDSPVVGSQLQRTFTGHCIKRVEAHGPWDGTEAGKVLKSHLGGTVITWGAGGGA